MLGNNIPVPSPATRSIKIQRTVEVCTSRRYMSPIPVVVKTHPDQTAHRKLPVIETIIPTTTEAGATVNVCGKIAIPALMGL
jgi:hypothetical protein